MTMPNHNYQLLNGELQHFHFNNSDQPAPPGSIGYTAPAYPGGRTLTGETLNSNYIRWNMSYPQSGPRQPFGDLLFTMHTPPV